MTTEKYGIEEYLKEFEEIVSKGPVKSETKQQIPNLLEMMRAKKGLNKEQQWPLT